ncbi:GNAT family N-acetyltransferase, partial [bacterium]|nr:GNAT family N-acetyltransferase [bacterium]
TIRHYTALGLLTPVEVRNIPSGGRQGIYPPEVIERLKVLEMLKKERLSLEEIASFFRRIDIIGKALNIPLTVFYSYLRCILEKRNLTISLSKKNILTTLLFWTIGDRKLEKAEDINLYITLIDDRVKQIPLYIPLKEEFILPLKEEDFPYIAKLSLQCNDILNTGFSSFENIKSLFTDLSFNYRIENFYVYKYNNEILGYVGLMLQEFYPHTEKVGLIGPIVHPMYRFLGVGTTLMKFIINKAKDLGAKEIRILIPNDNKEAIQWITEKWDFILEYQVWHLECILSKFFKVRIPKGVEFRSYKKGKDASIISELYNIYYERTSNFTPLENIEKFPGFDPDGIFIASIGDKPVGFCNFIPQQNRIGELIVLEPYKNQGIERVLLAMVLNYALKIGSNKVSTTVLAENRYELEIYKKFGFKITKNLFGYKRVI